MMTIRKKETLIMLILIGLSSMTILMPIVNLGKAINASYLPQATAEPTPTPFFPPMPGTWYQNGAPIGYFIITSPINQSYNSNALLLTVSGWAYLPSIIFLNYSLDGEANATIQITTPPSMSSGGNFQAKATLQQLAQGQHTLNVFGELDFGTAHYAENSTDFTINLPVSSSTPTTPSTPIPTPSVTQTPLNNASASPTNPTNIPSPTSPPNSPQYSPSSTPAQTSQITQSPNPTPTLPSSATLENPTSNPTSGFVGSALPTEQVLATTTAVLIIIASLVLLKRSNKNSSRSKTNDPHMRPQT
jgi:hypothetical protein